MYYGSIIMLYIVIFLIDVYRLDVETYPITKATFTDAGAPSGLSGTNAGM